MKTLKLMVKTHNVTGLKYLCVTVRKNWQNYRGSGKYWRQHLKKHGEDFSTELLVELPESCSSTFNDLCLKESIVNNVVESDDWANLCHETGYQGGIVGLCDESRRKMSEAKRGNKNNLGKKFSEEHRQKLSEAASGRKHSNEVRQKMSNSRRGKVPSLETLQKMSKSQRGNKNALGNKHSPEARQKMSEARKAYYAKRIRDRQDFS